MQHSLLCVAARLTDDELLLRVQLLAREERDATVELVAHLVELDTRRLYLAQGYGSLFSYCTEVLRLAEHAAYNRIEAARATRKFPRILDRLTAGTVNLSTLRLLAPHLTPDNHLRVLDEAARKSKREVEALVARLAPRPDVKSSVRKLPSPRLLSQAQAVAAVASPADVIGHEDVTLTYVALDPAAPATFPPVTLASVTGAPVTGAFVTGVGATGSAGDGTAFPSGALAVAPPVADRALIEPLSPERYRVQFTVGRETLENLRRAQALLRREVPDGDPGAIFDRAVKLLLDDVARRKFAATSKPRPARAPAAGSRRIPARVKRAVWLRDVGQCAFVARSGHRCRERSFLEFHHVHPYAIGGEATVANLSLRCRAHNVHETDRVFGRTTSLGVDGARPETHPDDRVNNSPRGESKWRREVAGDRPRVRTGPAAGGP